MNRLTATRTSAATAAPRRRMPFVFGLGALLSLSAVRCNDRQTCEHLRDDLFAEKLSWQGCRRDADCVIVGGNTGDCTGILSCNFAVNRAYRENAERRVASLPEETVDCHKCESPNCEKGELPYCEPITGHCIIIDRLLDGGTAGVTFVPPPPKLDAGSGSPLVPPETGPADAAVLP